MNPRTKLAVLALALAALASCQKTFFAEPPTDSPRAIFQSVWQEFAGHYGCFEARPVDWSAVRAHFEPQVSDDATDEQLYQVLTAMLSIFDDGHVQLTAPGKPVFYANRYYRERTDDDCFDLNVLKTKYLGAEKTVGEEDEFVFGLLAGEIIYVYFPHVGPNFSALDEAIEKYPQARGLIVDLRHNSGGDFTFAFEALGRFTSEKRLVFSSRTKNGTAANDFTGWHEWYLEPRGGPIFSKKIAVLTDRYTLSAGERAAMTFDVLPQAVLLGDTTNGSQSTMVGREMANGWHFTLPTQQTRRADGLTNEGIGIAPDIRLRNDPGALRNGRDEVLEKAIGIFQ